MAGHRRKKRIMRAFKINEISAVDRPAQEGARAVILKRRGEPGYDPTNPDRKKRGRNEGGTDEVGKDDSIVVLLTSVEDGHTHAVWIRRGENGGSTSFGSAPGDERSHDHPWVMDAQGNITIGENDGHGHSVEPDQFVQALMAMASSRLADEVAEAVGKRQFSSKERERLADKGFAMSDGSFPIVTKADLKNAVAAFGRAKNKAAVARHIKKRARALGATDLLPEEGALAALLKSSEASDEIGSQEDDTMSDKTKKTDDEVKAIETRASEAEAKLVEANARGDMNDAQKKYFDGLDETLDDDKRASFVKATPAERQALVDEIEKRAKDKDAVVFTAEDGTEYRKSDDPRLVAMAKRNDKLAKDGAEATKISEEAGLRKRAEEQLANMPGTIESRMALLKAAEGIEDKDDRKAAVDALHAHNAQMADAFRTAGVGAGGEVPVGGSEEQLDKMAKKHAEDNKVSYEVAYDVVIQTAEGGELYSKSLEENSVH